MKKLMFLPLALLMFSCSTDDIAVTEPSDTSQNEITEGTRARADRAIWERQDEIVQIIGQLQDIEVNIILADNVQKRYLARKADLNKNAPILELSDLGDRTRFYIRRGVVPGYCAEAFTIVPKYQMTRLMGPSWSAKKRMDFKKISEFRVSNAVNITYNSKWAHWYFIDPIASGQYRIKNMAVEDKAGTYYDTNAEKWTAEGYLTAPRTEPDKLNPTSLVNRMVSTEQEWKIQPAGTWFMTDVQFVPFNQMLLTPTHYSYFIDRYINQGPSTIVHEFTEQQYTSVSTTFGEKKSLEITKNAGASLKFTIPLINVEVGGSASITRRTTEEYTYSQTRQETKSWTVRRQISIPAYTSVTITMALTRYKALCPYKAIFRNTLNQSIFQFGNLETEQVSHAEIILDYTLQNGTLVTMTVPDTAETIELNRENLLRYNGKINGIPVADAPLMLNSIQSLIGL